MQALQVGAKAPDFELKAAGGEAIRLSELLKEGKSVILAFYAGAWSSVCGSEMTLFQETLDEFKRLGADLVGISEDNAFSIQAWAEAKGLTFLLLSDFNPRGKVAREYGVLREDGMAERALFVVDPKGVIRYSYVSPIKENPGADRLVEALEKMRAESKQP